MQIIYDTIQNFKVITLTKTVTCPAIALIDADEIMANQNPLGDVIVLDENGKLFERVINKHKD